jgi:hypothetical protein
MMKSPRFSLFDSDELSFIIRFRIGSRAGAMKLFSTSTWITTDYDAIGFQIQDTVTIRYMCGPDERMKR